MENKALRFNENKPKWSLIHYKSLEPMIRVLEFGEKKYGAFNWQKPGLEPKEILESLQRHLASLMDGQDLDKETKLHHIGHIMSNAMMYSYHNVINNPKSQFSKEKVPVISLFRDNCY